MKQITNELIEEISDFLVIYLKAGKIGLNSFIKKTNLKITQLDQLLNLHFLLKEDVKQFVRELPFLIRNIKTSTKVKQELNRGQVRGQINWYKTMNERFRINASDKTIFSVVERNREYAIKENLVLLEAIRKIYTILFEKLDSKYYEKFSWFEEWIDLKEIILNKMHKNIYLNRIKEGRTIVTERMILDTMKHRHRLYQQAAEILYNYNQLFEQNYNKELIQQLLQETFIFPKEEDVLFELYWIVQLIRSNTTNAEVQLIDGRNNLVAQWIDEEYIYIIFITMQEIQNLLNFMSQ